MKGQEPDAISDIIRDNELIALPKGESDIRPIGIGFTIRKITSMIAFRRLKDFNLRHFGSSQFALARNGCENVIHSLVSAKAENPTWDMLCLDADNAFNRANRIKGLLEVHKHAPEMLPFLKEMYFCISRGWYFGRNDGISSVNSSNGFHQGDVLASWLYVMTIQPLLKMIDEVISEDNVDCVNNWYADDGNILAPFPTMKKIVEILHVHGPSFGYFMKKNKGAYVVGIDTRENSLQRTEYFNQNYNFDPTIFKHHPSTNLTDDSNYGCKVLGSYIGSSSFIQKGLKSYINDLERNGEELIAYPNLQGRMNLFLKCFCTKPLFLLRT